MGDPTFYRFGFVAGATLSRAALLGLRLVGQDEALREAIRLELRRASGGSPVGVPGRPHSSKTFASVAGSSSISTTQSRSALSCSLSRKTS